MGLRSPPEGMVRLRRNSAFASGVSKVADGKGSNSMMFGERRDSVQSGAAERQSLFMRRVQLEEQLHDFVLVRYLVGVAIVAGAFFARHVVGIDSLDVPMLCALAGVLVLCNMAIHVLIRPYRSNRERASRNHRFLIRVFDLTIAADFICLTVALWLVGGAQSPFQSFFLLNIIIASVMLSPRAAYVNTLFAYLLLAGLTVGTWLGWIPAHYPEGAVPWPGPISGRFVLTILVVQGILFAATVTLTTHLMNLLRDGQRAVLNSNRELRRLSRHRRDFLNIALHDMRSPLSTADMLLGNLREGYGGELTEKQDHCVGRVQHRLSDIAAFLKDLETLATLNTGDLGQFAESLDICEILAELVWEYGKQAEMEGHELILDLTCEPNQIHGIPRLVREAVVNLLTNAIKYSVKRGRIEVRAVQRNNSVRIEVQDNGVGIAPEDQKLLFQEFVRVNKNNPATARIPGSGLGLFIVRRVAEIHGGSVSLESRQGEGSTFAIELPKAE